MQEGTLWLSLHNYFAIFYLASQNVRRAKCLRNSTRFLPIKYPSNPNLIIIYLEIQFAKLLSLKNEFVLVIFKAPLLAGYLTS